MGGIRRGHDRAMTSSTTYRCLFCGKVMLEEQRTQIACLSCMDRQDVVGCLSEALFILGDPWRVTYDIWIENLGMRRYLPEYGFMNEAQWDDYVERRCKERTERLGKLGR